MLRERPVMRTRSVSYVARRNRRRSAISWWFSLLFVIPLAIFALGYMGALPGLPSVGSASDGKFHLSVTDAYTGKKLKGAVVTMGGVQLTSDKKGRVKFDPPLGVQTLSVAMPNYEIMTGQISDQTTKKQTVSLRPTTLAGQLLDSESGQPIAGAIVSTESLPSTGDPITSTDQSGQFRLENVPAASKLYIDAAVYGVHEEDIAERTTIDVSLKKSLARGTVTDEAGHGLANATVRAGRNQVLTAQDGSFEINGAPPGNEITVSASGFDDATIAVPADGVVSALMRPFDIKALYIGVLSIADPERVAELVKLVDDTELNAIVLDVKQDHIFYDTQVQFFRDIPNMVAPQYDINAYLKMFQDHGIYAIARMVVFKDPMVAEARPDLAIPDDRGNGLWRDGAGTAWVDPTKRELWDANIALALELAQLGFDEVQYDYIRLPSDDIQHAGFPFDWQDPDQRMEPITGMVKASSEVLKPTGVKFALDLFGVTSVLGDDQGIGQDLTELAPYVDYVCPMIYPSHFSLGFFNLDDPNQSPYDTIWSSMDAINAQLPGMERKVRPWLQDFSWGDEDIPSGPGSYVEYGPDQVRAQIEAAQDKGASGWMLWDASNVYTEDALDPES
jgi:hypothetical protein